MSNENNIERQKSFWLPQGGEIIELPGRRYFVAHEIGQGYFGAVFQCTDEWDNELVAKVLLPRNRTYEEVRREWLDELQNLVALRHPNITYVYDAFEYRDTFFLIIERCSSTLTDLISMPNLQGEIWLPYVARDLLQAIDFIHKAGYVHKDIHSGNVFTLKVKDKMAPSKSPVFVFKVGDLGISRLESDINIFNTILAQWMLPPEFLNPTEFGVIGRQVDIYHAGLLLLSLLVAHIPQFTPEQILAGIPRQMAEGLSSPYGNAIARALRRHVNYRTSSALEFWRDICQVIRQIGGTF